VQFVDRPKIHRWPAPPKYCVWDCGNYWDGYDSPTHVGLTNELRDEYIKNLERWRDSCVLLSRQKTHCLKKANATSARNAVMLAKKSEYMQEVCGEYIDESAKYIKDNQHLIGILYAVSVFFPFTLVISTPLAIVAGATVAGVQDNVGAGRTDGSNETGWSIFADDTAKHVTDREYR
jgi:hypothetical protein